MAAALARVPTDARVVVVASGGLSHFLCEEAFDRRIVSALESHDMPELVTVQ